MSSEPNDQTPGAGPSRSTETEERDLFSRRRKDYVQLEQSVQSSNELLSSLASYLSTFQHDLSAVSGQISDLQSRSADIEGQLSGRKTILPPLNALLSDITLPPALILTIRDTQPAQNPELWLSAVAQLDDKIIAIKSRGKVKAANQMDQILNGLLVKALQQLPPFLLSLIRPLKSASKGLSTNLAVLQTSLLLKYQSFYVFLLRHSPRLAKQVERGYVTAARAYYETGFRRYTRALGQIRARTSDRVELLGSVPSDAALSAKFGSDLYDRLQYADLDSAGAMILAYMADDRDYRVPIESLFRSLGLVLVDNASAEFTFIIRFFGRTQARSRDTPLESPSLSHASSEVGTPRRLDNEDSERIWHEVLDTALESCTAFFDAIIANPPPAIPLITLIRLNDSLLSTSESRGTIPLLSFLQRQKLAMWPIFRKEMDQHVESLKRLADDSEAKGLTTMLRGVKDSTVRHAAGRYAAIFSCVTALSCEAEEAMIFSSMTRLRTELVRLVNAQSKKIKAASDRQSFLSSIFETIMHELVAGPGQTTHPRLQTELSYFRTREEEVRRRGSS